MALKTCWIFNSTSNSGPQMKSFNSLWSRSLGKKHSSQLLITESRKQAAYKKRVKQERKKKQREEWIETVQTVSLTHPGQHWAVHHTVHMLRDLCWLQLTVKFPLGLGGGRWQKSSQLYFQHDSCSFKRCLSLKIWKNIVKPRKVTQSILLVAFFYCPGCLHMVLSVFLFFLLSCRWEPLTGDVSWMYLRE